MKWTGHTVPIGITEMHIRCLVGKSERKGPLGKRMCKWDDIKTNLTEIGWKGSNWNGMAQNRDRRRALFEHGNEYSGSIKCREFLN